MTVKFKMLVPLSLTFVCSTHILLFYRRAKCGLNIQNLMHTGQKNLWIDSTFFCLWVGQIMIQRYKMELCGHFMHKMMDGVGTVGEETRLTEEACSPNNRVHD